MSSQPKATEPSNQPAPEVPLSREVLTDLFSIMLKARFLAKRFRTSVHTRESILAGTLQNVSDRDLIVSASSNPILEALRGDNLPTLVRKKKDPEPPAQSHVIVPPGDAVASFAAGLAIATCRGASDAAVIVFTPGQKTRGSVFEQATKYAAEHRVPLVIVADWTASRTSSRNHDGATLSHWPFPTIAVDGRDVIAVYRVTKEAINAARRGHGPTLVDCVNFLAPGSRGRDQRDPLLAFRGYLQRHNAWSDEWYAELEANLKRELVGPKGVTN
ncbi:MAG: thiamine pyrophosphate-dependent enzyme [Terriglobales bacterium]